jgi:Domain of unknown function (DUF4382)
MNSLVSRLMLGLTATAMVFFTAACGTTSKSSTPPPSKNGTVNMMMSDASSEDWATIGVKVSSISLTPMGAGSPVVVYTAASPLPVVNLVQLDQLSEILANVTVAAGTYTGATITISANPGDVLLTAAADPEAGFAGTAGATIPSAQIQIMGAAGAVGSLTVPVDVTFASPLVVVASQSNALDLEFVLADPVFLVPHVDAVAGNIWAVNFDGPVRQRPIADITHLLLRHIYGTATSVSTDNTSIAITKDFPLVPAASPETGVASSESLTILADSTNGTIVYDVDAHTVATVMDFSTLAATLDGKFVRVAARFQAAGELVAVRMWVSTLFNSIWISPEGHVLHVNTTTDILTVEDEAGVGVPVTVNSNTQFFLRTPASGLADATAIGTGTAFLSNVKRGFKVHASAVDPLASPLVAQTVDIELARYDGNISAATATNFLDTRVFHTVTDNYALTLPFISSSTANGADPVTGDAITGFKWWNAPFPTDVNSGATAVGLFDSAVGGSATFGGTVGAFTVAGESRAVWNDPIAVDAFALPSTILVPSKIPLGSATTGYAAGSFTMAVTGGALSVTIDLSTTVGSATLVYQINRTANVVTITPVDITTPAGVTAITAGLIATTPVKVFGVPQANGSIKAFVVFFYTGTAPGATS